MVYCPKCYAEVKEGAAFCGNCGKKLDTVMDDETMALRVHSENMITDMFGKSIASVVCAMFPIACVIAIFLGRETIKIWSEANRYAEKFGFRMGGKARVMRILGKVGFIAGIAMTGYWTLAFLWMILINGQIL